MPKVSLRTIFFLFLKLGTIGFGGPIALISLMEQECSHKRGWLSLEEFNERYVICKLLPGSVASQMAMWMGYHVRGKLGGIIAGASFLLPSFVLILGLSIWYSRMTSLPGLGPVIEGMEAGALVVILESVIRMFVPYLRQLQAWLFMLVAAGLMLFIPHWEPLIILSGGMILILYRAQAKRRGTLYSIGYLPLVAWLLLFWVHFKAGITVFGTGLAVVPVLQHAVVDHFHWLSRAAFLDGIAFGQITPGPVTISSVFIGYRTAGLGGAVFAFLGMYSPGVIIVLFVVPHLFDRLKTNPHLGDFQQGAIPTVIGCILGATVMLARETITRPSLIGIIAVLGLLTWRFKLPGWLVILLGSALDLGARALNLIPA